MNSQKNGRNHFLVGQEMNGSVVVSCIETKSPSGNRWLKIHREFKLKNGSKFWLDKLISREKGEETLADWLEEQAQLRAKKEAAQAKAREMAKKRIQARNGEGLAPAAHSTKPVKTKLELPSKKHKAATIQSSSNTVKKPASLKPSTKSHNTGMDPVGQTQISFTDKDGSEVETQSSMPRIPKSPKRTQKPASARTLLREENTADVVKSPKKPTSLRTKTFHSGDDIEASPKKESSGRLQVEVSPSGKASKRSSSRDRKLRSRRESSRKAKTEAEENAHVEVEKMALRGVEENTRFEVEEIAIREAVENTTDVAKSRKKPTSLRTKTFHSGDDIEASPKKESSGRLQVDVSPSGKATKRSSSRDRKLRSRRESSRKAKKEAEENAHVEAEEMALRAAEEKARFETEELARQEAEEKARVEAEEMARREAEQKARFEAEELARQEAEEKACVEAEEMAQREAEQKARLEAEELARQEAEEKTRVEAEEMAQREAEQKARLEAVENATVENATLTKQAEERGRVEELSHVDEESQRIEHSKDEAGEKSLVETLDGERQSLGTADLIANLPDDEHSSTAVVEKTPPLPYDEVLADSGSRLAHSDSDIDTKKKRRKKKEIASAKSEDKKRRKPKGKRLGELGSEASGMDLHESSIIETKRRKSKTPTESRDWASAGSGMDLSDSSKNKKKKKKKKDSRKDNDTDASHDELEQSQNSFRAHDSKTKKKTKKKKKEKGENSASTKTNKEKQKEAVVSDIHTQLEAMFELPVEVQLVGIEEVADDSNKFQNVPMVPPFKDDDSDDEGSAEFHVDPSMMDNPLDDYSSDEPSSDSDDDFDYTRVAGINDFDNNGVGMNQRASALHSSKVIVDAAADAEDSGHDEQGEEAISPGLESKENMNFSSLEEMKDVSPSFAKIMGVWVERENKVLYRTPLETVDKKGDGKKEVPVPAGPEAPSLGSMVKKWEAKFIKEEAEKTEDAPRKLKNVWAEKLEFTKPFTKPSHNKSADDIKLIEDTVEKNFAFKDLTLDEMAPIIDAFERVEYDLGATIGQQGEPEGFYSIVQSGEVAFHSDGNKVGSAVAGDAFGELSLLYSVPLAAEAKAVGNETVLFQLNRMDFRHIVREQMIRSEEEKLKLLQSVEVFKNLDETDLRQLASAMTPHQFNIGQNLTSTFAEAPFCLVQQGSVSATDVPIGPGESFGEKYLIAKENKRYEVKALSDGTAFTIDRESFEKVFGDFDRVSMKYRDKQTLASIRQIKAAKLEEDQLDTLVRQIAEVEFKAGTEIFELNAKMPPALYFVRSGQVKIVKKSGEERIITAGQHFGEEYMFFTSKQSKDVVPEFVVVKYSATAAEKTVCGVLTLEEVGIVSGRIQAIQDIETTKNIALENLDRHRILGEGQFGVVWLVTVKTMEADPYALKIQYTDDPSRDDPAECIREEIKMMRSVQHPFIIQVINTYEDEETISMLLSLAPGGELFDVLHRQDANGWWISGLAEPIAKFYTMVVADTLAFMHRQRYVYRDLKPENILIDKDGYPVLTDFGFVKKLENGKTYTFCGTPNYVAPEVVVNVGHDTNADNWSLGVLIYELIDGANPFWEDGMDQQTLYELIVYGLHPPLSRKKCSKAGRDLIGRLLEKDPSKRIGNFREKDILEHKWFEDFDLEDLREKIIRAPWVPDKLKLQLEEG